MVRGERRARRETRWIQSENRPKRAVRKTRFLRGSLSVKKRENKRERILPYRSIQKNCMERGDENVITHSKRGTFSMTGRGGGGYLSPGTLMIKGQGLWVEKENRCIQESREKGYNHHPHSLTT